MVTRILRCSRCAEEFEARRSDAKWCSNCKGRAHKNIELAFEKRHRHPCPTCGAEVARTSVHCRLCGNKSGGTNRSGDKHRDWKGGRSRDRYGYILILVAPEARKGHRYRAEHILVWEAAHGPLPKGYIVHHINHIKDDNRLENLEAMPRAQHNHSHGERRIRELEAENAALREQLNVLKYSGSKISP